MQSVQLPHKVGGRHAPAGVGVAQVIVPAMPRRYSAAVTALIHAAVGAAWLVGSDALLARVTVDPLLAERIRRAKGIAFVALSGVLLFLLLRAG